MVDVKPSQRIDEGDWLLPRLGYSSVTGFVPVGYPAYVRILHPAWSRRGAAVRWAQVAAWSGRLMHRLAEFHRIADPLPGFGGKPEPWDGGKPEIGSLAPELLRVLCETLREHTTTEDVCWFGLWDGYAEFRGNAAPLVILPGRGYVLFEGPLMAALEADWAPNTGMSWRRQSPNIFWPQDRAWCVASEIDLCATFVAGSVALINALIANPALEAWRVEPTDSVTSDGDRLNS